MRNAYVYLLATASQAAAPIVLMPLQRLTLGLEGLGYAILAATIASTVGLAGTLGVADSVLRRRLAGQVSESQSARLIRFAPLVATIPVVTIAIGLWLFRTEVAPGHTVTGVVGAAVGVPIAALLISQQSLRAEERAWAFYANVLAWQLGSVLLGLAAAEAGGGLSGYLAAWGGGITLAALVAMWRAHAFHRFDPGDVPKGPFRSDYSEAVKLGFPVLLHQLIGAAVLMLDRLLLSAFHSGEAIATYQAVYLVGLAPVAVLASVNAAWGVQVFKGSDEDRWHRQRAGTRLLAGGALAMSGGVIFFAEPAMRVLLGGGIDTTVAVLSACALSALAVTQVAYTAGLNALYYVGRTKALASRTVPSAVLQAGMSASTTPFLGVPGPPIAAFSAQTIQAFAVWKQARRITPMLSAPRELIWGALLGWAGAGVVLVGGLEFLPYVGAALMIAGCGIAFREYRLHHRGK